MEQGTHDELLRIVNGVYYNLWHAQLTESVKEEVDAELEEEIKAEAEGLENKAK